MNYYEWNITEYDKNCRDRLSGAGVPPLAAALLSSRGYGYEDALELINCTEALLADEWLLKDIRPAVERILRAVEHGEHIAVYGDYDVDGITSVYVLLDWLRGRGADCEGYIPSRLSEGYGINTTAIDQLHSHGTSLLISVDCGITAIAETEYARSLGIDVVITDHHECQGDIPSALAVINPKRPDCPYPNKQLAGVGVAFKLTCALEGDRERILERYGDIVAIGTVADVMPLVGENRFLVRRGMEKLASNAPLGIRRLMQEAGVDPKRMTATTISFMLAPRINAAGRMGEAMTALELLTSRDEVQAANLAGRLCSLNRSRQLLENQIFEEAISRVDAKSFGVPVVLESSDWHQGVAGIVASRLSERFAAPAIVICLDGDHGKGSCRSFGSFNLFDALEQLSDYLDGFGGHAFAAGLTISRENIEPFRRAFAEYYEQKTAGALPFPALNIDFTVDSPELLTLEAIDSLSMLEPFGNSNEKPTLCLRDVRLERLIPISNGKHLRAIVSAFGRSYDCICFSKTAADFGVTAGEQVELAFTPQVNEYHNIRSVQLLLADMRPAESEFLREVEEFSVYDRWRAGEELTAEQLASLLPVRRDFAVLWRRITSPGFISVGHRATVLHGLSHLLPPQKALICLEVFSELGLIELYNAKGAIRILPLDTEGKVDLASSEILQKLEAAAGGR